MNSFGRIFRVHIFGESHGESVGIVIDGCPAGLHYQKKICLPDLERRKGGKQKGTTPRQEADYPFFKSGLFNGKTTGAPSLSFLKIIIPAAQIMKSNEVFRVPGMLIW